MDLFNDIDFDNNNNGEFSKTMMKTTIPIEIGDMFIKRLGLQGIEYPVVQDHYLLILDDEPSRCTGQYKTREGDILPYSYNMLSCLFSFNDSFTHLNYIQVYPVQYENNPKIVDDDAYAILFANILFNEYDIMTDNIIYEVKNIRTRFTIQTSSKRRLEDETDKLTLGFVQNFPKLINSEMKKVAYNLYIRQCKIESEQCFIELCKQLIEQYSWVSVNLSTCYIGDVPLYNYNTVNNDFFKTIIDNADITNDVIDDDYAMIDRRIINMLTKLTEGKMQMNKHKIKKYIFEDLFDDFDDIVEPESDNSASELINNQLDDKDEYLLNFFSTYNNETYNYKIQQNYLILLYNNISGGNTFKTPDNDELQYSEKEIYCVIKYNETHKIINYIIFNDHTQEEKNWINIKLPLFTLQQNLYEKFKIKINNIYISANPRYTSFIYGNPDIIARKCGKVYIENRNIPDDAYENISNKIFKIGIPQFLTANNEKVKNISVTTLRFNTISSCFTFLKQLQIQTTYGELSVDTLGGIKIKDKNFISSNKIRHDYKLKDLFYADNRWFTLYNDYFERMKNIGIIKENINYSFYKTLIESIAVDVKKILNEDRYDYGHNTPSSHLKQRLSGVLKNKFGYAPLPSKTARIGKRDILIGNRNNVSGFPSKFSIAIVERKKDSEDNFRIPISRKDEQDILSDDNIKYVLFPKYVGTSEADYIVYMLDKDDILKIYNNLKSILDRCKEEIKQGKRDRKTIKVNKSIADKYKNFLAPTAGNDGLCLSNQCIEKLSVYTFKLKNKIY